MKNGCSFQQVLWENLSWFYSQHMKTLFLRGFMSKPTEKAYDLLKNSTESYFQNS